MVKAEYLGVIYHHLIIVEYFCYNKCNSLIIDNPWILNDKVCRNSTIIIRGIKYTGNMKEFFNIFSSNAKLSDLPIGVHTPPRLTDVTSFCEICDIIFDVNNHSCKTASSNMPIRSHHHHWNRQKPQVTTGHTISEFNNFPPHIAI